MIAREKTHKKMPVNKMTGPSRMARPMGWVKKMVMMGTKDSVYLAKGIGVIKSDLA